MNNTLNGKRLKSILMVLLLSFFGIFNCSPNIGYSMYGVRKNDVTNLRQFSISIQPFKDDRKRMSYLKEAIFNPENDNKIDCYNLEFKYKKISISKQLSVLLSEHIDSIGVFKKVFFDRKDDADFYLTGNIISFAAHTNVNEAAKGTQEFGAATGGLLGGIASAIATSGMKSYYDFEIKYLNIVLFDKSGNVIYQIPETVTFDKKEIPAVTNCSEIFNLINNELKIHHQKIVDQLISELPNKLKNISAR